MTYALGRVMYELERADAWVQNLITYSDIIEVAGSELYVYEIRGRLITMARERRDSK